MIDGRERLSKTVSWPRSRPSSDLGSRPL